MDATRQEGFRDGANQQSPMNDQKQAVPGTSEVQSYMQPTQKKAKKSGTVHNGRYRMFSNHSSASDQPRTFTGW